MKRPRLNLLRTFEVAGRRLSFSLAAQELNISQAAVSQQIRNLEAYLGSPLFVRAHRKLTLSSTGVAYLASVSEALDRLDSVTDNLFPDRPSQSVTISCTSSIATLWLAPRFGAFRQVHPEIDLRIRTLEAERTGEPAPGVDLEIFISDNAEDEAEARMLLRSTITPVASPKLLKEHASTVMPADILNHDLIHVTGYAEDWHRWFRTHGLDDVMVPRGLIVDGSLIALEAAIHGDGVALGRRPFVDQYLRSGQLAEVFGTKYTLNASYYLRQVPRRTPNKSVGRVRRWLLDQAKQD